MKPTLAVWKFSSCDGCQLSLLDCEDELLLVSENVDIAHFAEATRASKKGPYDISIVEGSVSTAEEAQRIQDIREQSTILITIGACATAGGIQALKNFKNVDDFISIVYAHPEYIDTLAEASPISAHVAVDFELRGCPINKQQLLEVLNALLNKRKPNIIASSVCMECKLKGNVCLMVSRQKPCMGPVTHAGCDALCPTYERGCFGCYGPKENCQPAELTQWLKNKKLTDKDILRLYRNFNALAEDFKKESIRHDN
jgi:coenzyme F420-reducing hydrogenase gamma subunit